jgi:hypothetical protein
MGRFDILTQLEETQVATDKPNTPGVAPVKKHSPAPLPEKAKPQDAQGTETKQHGAVVPEPVRVPVRVRVGVPPPVPLIPKVKRVIRQRQPFDIYEDQYQQLKKIAEEEKGFENGRGMSQMVREAIDTYFKDHTASEE